MKHHVAAEYGKTAKEPMSTDDMKELRKKARSVLDQLGDNVELTERWSTFVETRAVDLTFSSAQQIGCVCNYLLCLRDDTNGDLYYIDDYESFNSVENIYRLCYRGRAYKFSCSAWRRVELKSDAELYELH